MFQYNENFYKFIEQTKDDEKTIMPLIMQWLSPKSIVDFGCAEGAWLLEALHQNDKIDVLGMDGDYIDKGRLKISEANFKTVDLRQSIYLKHQYDLAISTEVAEHLELKYADIFIDNITRASSQILFSAAIPGQGGMHHVNEQWQSYWIEKFEKRGYYCDYSVRNYFWNESKISSWRKQNLLFFSKKRVNIAPEKPLQDVVHPEEAMLKQRVLKEKLKAADYYILNPEISAKFEEIIKKLITQTKKIVIYPYGNNGKLCERILSVKYGVTDYIIADNNVEIEGKKIVKAEQLKGLADDIFVIETCSNDKIHKEVLDELFKYVDIKSVYSAFKTERV